LKRRTPDEKVARLRVGRTPELFELASKATRWVADNRKLVGMCEPFIPDAIYNRAADNWEPLLAIAEVIGDYVPERARKVALAACGIEEEPSLGAMLLADIRDVFEERGCNEIPSEVLVAALVAMMDKPWCECNRGKPLTQNGLARKLKGFEIRPKDVGPENARVKGYKLTWFEDAFARYLPIDPRSPRSSKQINGLDFNQTAQQKTRCADANSEKRNDNSVLRGCAVGIPPNGDARVFADNKAPDGADNAGANSSASPKTRLQI
jgi:putative DNA primase/helicase